MYRVTELRTAAERAQLADQQGQTGRASQPPSFPVGREAGPKKPFGKVLSVQKVRSPNLSHSLKHHTHTQRSVDRSRDIL